MITLLVEKKTPRIEYMAQFLQNQLGTALFLTDDVAQQKGVTIAYQTVEVNDAIHIKPHGLLNSAIIENIKPEIEWIDNDPYFFRTKENGEMPFDILAAMFFMVTRYEELTIKQRDKHDRFMATSSLAYQNNFITRPVVDIWLNKLKEIISSKAKIDYKNQSYKLVPSVDVDSAFAFKNKPLSLQIAGLIKRLIKGEVKLFFEQILVHLGQRPDPYNTFEMLKSAFNKADVKVHFFVQIGNRGLHDKNLSYKNSAFRKVINDLKEHAHVGLHVSYAGAFDAEIIREECHKLQDVTGDIVKRNRFHFLRMDLPISYNLLENAGISEDYSMGFADHIGYRAGISKPYIWFDLKANRKTALKVTPFFVMDNSLRKYMGYTPAEAITKLKPALQEVKALNGHFCFLWHNSSFTEASEWKGWKVVFNWIMQNG